MRRLLCWIFGHPHLFTSMEEQPDARTGGVGLGYVIRCARCKAVMP